MTAPNRIEIGGYELDADRHYDTATHIWAQPHEAGTYRIGLDPLGVESCGDVVALSLAAPGDTLERAASFGSLEAAKFVGPLLAPVAGTVVAVNDDLLADPSLLNQDPLGTWMIEIRGASAAGALDGLVSGEAAVRPWFEREVERYRDLGALGE